MMVVAKGISDLRFLVVFITLVVSAFGSCQSEQQTDKAHQLPEIYPTIHPGTYSSEEFKPSISFNVGEGWKSGGEQSDSIWIAQGDPEKSYYIRSLGIINVSKVYEWYKLGKSDYVYSKQVPAPKDLVAWFHRHPYLQAGQPEPITVGGVNGVQFDVAVDRPLPKNFAAACGKNCVDLFGTSNERLTFLYEAFTAHIVILKDVKGDTVVIEFDSPDIEFDDFLPKAQKVVDSVKWEGE